MGIFFSESKKIKRDEFKRILQSIPELSDIEISYLQGVFQDALKDGISKEELKREIYDLKHDSNDPLDYSEVEKVKNKLEEVFK